MRGWVWFEANQGGMETKYFEQTFDPVSDGLKRTKVGWKLK